MKKLLALVFALLLAFGSFTMAEAYDDRLTIVAMKGDISDFVYVVETALWEKGYLLEDEIDGVYDYYTELAVKNFQTYKGFVPDGILTKTQFYWLHRTYYREWFDSSNIVYITESGTRDHAWDCVSIANTTLTPMPVSINIAEGLGYYPCRICNPW